MMEHAPGKTSPASLAQLPGVWRRDLIQTPDLKDTESQVFWLQGQNLFGDLRVEPTSRVAFSGQLLQQEIVFTWQMDLMSFDQPEFPDAGQLAWDGEDLWEFGVHQTYTELWRRAGSVGPGDFALWLTHRDGRHAARLRFGGFEFAQVGQPGQPSEHAKIKGVCPRFGAIETQIGEHAKIEEVMSITPQTVADTDWCVGATETF